VTYLSFLHWSHTHHSDQYQIYSLSLSSKEDTSLHVEEELSEESIILKQTSLSGQGPQHGTQTTRVSNRVRVYINSCMAQEKGDPSFSSKFLTNSNCFVSVPDSYRVNCTKVYHNICATIDFTSANSTFNDLRLSSIGCCFHFK
jgi:hypothetical protein